MYQFSHFSGVNCQWSQWTDCNATCGTGLKTRKIQIEAQYGGELCQGLDEMKCTSMSKCPGTYLREITDFFCAHV